MINVPDDEMILAFWDRRKNTADIADRYGCHESIIAKRLPRLLWARRQAAGVVRPDAGDVDGAA